MPVELANDFKKCATKKHAIIRMISHQREWYIKYLKATTKTMREPVKIAFLRPRAKAMTDYINDFLLPTLHKFKREHKLIPNC